MITPNNAFEEEMYYHFLKEPDSVSKEWQEYFSQNGFSKPENKSIVETKEKAFVNIDKTIDKIKLNENESLEPLSPISAKISVNMEASTEVPSATSIRMIPVKALDENRRLINKYLSKLKRTKVSFTHILLWAIVKSIKKFPQLNDAFTKIDGKPFRIKRKSINVGLAVDIEKKDGSRLLLVPNVKNAQDLNFSEFINAFDSIIEKSRTNKLDIDNLQGTSITLTNPGMIGTTASNPRLMSGQGMIIATGSIDYPTEFQAVRPDVLTNLAVSKVTTITNTYDHRIIQGAESAEFLSYINKLLLGEEQFYEQIFAALNIPFEPIRWQVDTPYKKYGTYDIQETIEKSAHVMQFINAYRVRGHLLASINPLGFESYYYPELDPAFYGFTIWDLERVFHADDSWENNNLPLRDIIELLRDTYCGHIGYEFMHIQSIERKEWIKTTLEKNLILRGFSKEEKLDIYKKLVDAETFENYLHTKFIGHKRFSLEGSESIIPLIDKIFELSADSGMNGVVLGMAHRGRLNVLVNNIGKNLSIIFDEFDEEIDPEYYHGSGDVKYHLGDKGNYISKKRNSIPIILSSNPSHLELVDPIIEGMARALDNEINDKTHSKTLPVLIHGDAAFAGQGIVAETLNFSQLDGYTTGGTIHIIINNQIGFTASPHDTRSSVYATDIAKMIQVPIIHVNGNDPEAVLTAAQFAFKYRTEFHCDVVIDVLSYRKYGHNEADEPTYTQPLLYKKIKSIPAVKKIYESQLMKEGVLNPDLSLNLQNEAKDKLNQAFNSRKKKNIDIATLTEENNDKSNFNDALITSVTEEILYKITRAVTVLPKEFNTNPKILNLLEKRAEMMSSEKPAIDWAMAEALAFGTILLDGKGIRFSGQDTRRGTFSQRHAALTDFQTEDIYIPLNNIQHGQAKLRIYDSPLSELAILGFEYGYSVISKDCLTLWEAQFGDFDNMAQPIIDQFIVPAELKWGQTSNLVLLLPHSYDGQGAEHSSARLERFLQLSAENNIKVCNLSTPAQYFHALRRQTLMQQKKPLILMTPKSMLRNPLAVSSVQDLTDGEFQPIIDDKIQDYTKISRILLCSGKIYYDLLIELQKQNRQDIAIIRIEQLYPLHSDKLKEIIEQYSHVKEIFWVQEEPRNMGVFNYIAPKINELLPGNNKLQYIGRREAASPATGSFKVHEAEQKEIIQKAINE
jgi:multifunctional 2-oxoglutarate metabolism enzyme